MSPDRADREENEPPPNSEPEEYVYVENEEGEPRMAGRPDSFRERYWAESDGFVSPGVYVTLLIVGVVLLLFPEPITSTIGVVLVALGLFLAAVDAFSPG